MRSGGLVSLCINNCAMNWTDSSHKIAFIKAIKQLLFSPWNVKVGYTNFFSPLPLTCERNVPFLCLIFFNFSLCLFCLFRSLSGAKISRNNGILIKRTNVTFWMTVWHCIYVLIITWLLITFLQQPINENNCSAVIGIKRTLCWQIKVLLSKKEFNI